jgi:hypothetical protein
MAPNGSGKLSSMATKGSARSSTCRQKLERNWPIYIGVLAPMHKDLIS